MNQIRAALRKLGGPERAAASAWFFKTGPGEYGEGDRFVGASVPSVRRLAGRCRELPAEDLEKLLYSRIHEERLLALLVLVQRYQRGEVKEQAQIFRFYLKHRCRVNNWDLVDLSAPQIVGAHLLGKDRRLLHRLAGSRSLWDRRMAVVSTYSFIRAGDGRETFKICKRLLADEEDLIHKACGWMLREAGKRDGAALRAFLKKHLTVMPRTMLRYAIERFPARERRAFLSGRV